MSIPRAFQHLVDDAAIFPPGLAALPAAVAAHTEHLASDHADLVGPFVTDTARLDALASLAPDGFAVTVVVPGPDAVATTLAQVRAPLVLAGLEVRLDPRRSAVDQVHKVAAALATAPRSVTVSLEAPRPGTRSWSAVLAAVAAAGLRLKFRTGGTEAAAFPSEAEVTAWITDAVGAGVPFKCTAGLHHAVRHTSRDTGFEHHGYLNVLLATARATAGAGPGEVAAALAERDAQALAEHVVDLDAAALDRARAAFTSYGSCSVLEPLEDLTRLRLLTLSTT